MLLLVATSDPKLFKNKKFPELYPLNSEPAKYITPWMSAELLLIKNLDSCGSVF